MKMLPVQAAMLLLFSVAAAEDKPEIGGRCPAVGRGTGQVRVEEQWNKPVGGTMQGLSRTLKNGKTIFSEFMRISQEEGKIVYTARIGTKAVPTPFELIRMSTDEAVFENAAHPFPQRIRYRREANGDLFARIEGMDKGKARSEDYPMQRTGCY